MYPENQNPQQPQQSPAPPQPTATNPAPANGIISGGIDPSLMPKPPKKRNNLVIVIVASVIAIVLIVAGFAFLMLNSKPDNPKNGQSKDDAKVSPENQPGKDQDQRVSSNPGDDLDKERKKDIDNMNSVLISFMNDGVIAPTLAEINDPNFRKKEIPSLKDEMLRDPESEKYVLAAGPTIGAYSYEPFDSYGDTCSNATSTTISANPERGTFACTQYKLTAVLEDGTKYEKSAKSPEF